ncbi:MAG: hypothetical protein CMD18_07255 [Flavobacteriales bacterium]|nr:hypothetical protein [Flavobacteriales bacterium]|tara:strand:+ start:1009 stop:2106 length:1098 start_codon:yes stop_codon:yes gene_type:complete
MVNKKVVIVLPFFTLGGAETQAVYIAESFIEVGVDVTIVAFEEKNRELLDVLKKKNIKNALIDVNLSKVHQKGLGKLRMLFIILFKIRKLKPDYIFPLTYYPNILTSAIWRFTGAKKCFWNQRGLEQVDMNLIERIAVKMKPSYLANAQVCASYIADRHDLSVQLVDIIPNAITITEEKEDWRKKLGLKNGTLLYTYVANYYPEKNHEIVLKGWAEFSASVNENVKLVLLGYAPKPELEWKIKALLFDLNISNVLMLSSTNDIPGLLGVVSVGIQGSISEGCPNSTLEYLLYETLPIVSKIDAHKEIFGESYLGYFSVDSSSELAEILKNTISEDWRNKIREKNIGLINRYSIEKLSESYTNLIK